MRQGTFSAPAEPARDPAPSAFSRPPLPRWMGVEGYVDIHFHAIADVDDGPKSGPEALELALSAYMQGTLGIVATPHFSTQFPFRPESNAASLEQLEGECPNDLAVFPGCEMELTDEALRAFRRSPRSYTLNGSRYLLVELAGQGLPPQIDVAFEVIREAGCVPVLAHPERYSQLANHPNRLADWVQAGCLMQVTASSLLGRMGKRAESLAWQLVGSNIVQFIASDAHHLTKRPASLIEAFTAVAHRFGVPAAARMFTHHPLAVLHDEALR